LRQQESHRRIKNKTALTAKAKTVTPSTIEIFSKLSLFSDTASNQVKTNAAITTNIAQPTVRLRRLNNLFTGQ
jgi:hypothetical protein